MCDTNKRTPHKHAAVIKAWADGAEVQYRSDVSGGWFNSSNPAWIVDWDYRIKPERSDVDKYGVQVGDVWLMFDHDVRTHGVQDVNGGYAKVLLFRRGVVNKL